MITSSTQARSTVSDTRSVVAKSSRGRGGRRGKDLRNVVDAAGSVRDAEPVVIGRLRRAPRARGPVPRVPGGSTAFRAVVAVAALGALGALAFSPSAHADNSRLNNSVVINVYTLQHRAGCASNVKINPKLRLAAQWHTEDVLNNRALDGDVGSDGSSVADRARSAGYTGTVAETVAMNSSLAINNLEVLNQWYYRPDYYAILSDCTNIDIGVWSENSSDRSVVVAVFGKGEHPL